MLQGRDAWAGRGCGGNMGAATGRDAAAAVLCGRGRMQPGGLHAAYHGEGDCSGRAWVGLDVLVVCPAEAGGRGFHAGAPFGALQVRPAAAEAVLSSDGRGPLHDPRAHRRKQSAGGASEHSVDCRCGTLSFVRLSGPKLLGKGHMPCDGAHHGKCMASHGPGRVTSACAHHTCGRNPRNSVRTKGRAASQKVDSRLYI